jgi:hypothetical protein
MKTLMTSLLLLAVTALSAQMEGRPDSISFCFNKYEIPSSWSRNGSFEIKKDDCDFSWMYVSDDNLLFACNGLLNKLETYPGFSKGKISCFILNKRVNGYKVSFKRGNETIYQLIAYGIINEQPVLVQLALKKDPISNNDIPDFVYQIVRMNTQN